MQHLLRALHTDSSPAVVRQGKPFGSKREKYLTCASQLCKLAEHLANRLLDALVRLHLDLPSSIQRNPTEASASIESSVGATAAAKRYSGL